MRTASTLVGAPRAPDIDAQQRGRRRLSSSTNTPANHDHVPRTVTPTQTLLDRRRPAALPQNRSHLTHGTCRSALTGSTVQVGQRGWGHRPWFGRVRRLRRATERADDPVDRF